MKIGVNLVGISHLDNRTGQFDQRKRNGWNRNRPDHPPNIIENIIKPLQKHHDVFTYITTYNHEKIHELFEMYKPSNHLILDDFEGSTMQGTYIKSLENIIDENIDVIFSTRFDIVFKKTINEINYDPDKFNVLYNEKGWSHLKYTSDIVFIFPKYMISDIIESSKILYNYCQNGFHGLANELSKKITNEKIHVIDKIDQLGNINDYCYIPRHLYEPI